MFSLIWNRSTQPQIASIWKSADELKKTAVAKALKLIILELSVNPETAGESRAVGRRILTHQPLGVLFKVLPEKSAVRILKIWEY